MSALWPYSRESTVSLFSANASSQPSTRFHPSPWLWMAGTLPANPSWRILSSVPVPALRGPLECNPCTAVGSSSQRTMVVCEPVCSLIQVCTSRRGGSISRYSPSTRNDLPSAPTPTLDHLPPGRKSAVALVTRYMPFCPHHCEV